MIIKAIAPEEEVIKMDMILANTGSLYNWVLLPLLIFLARVMDVSIGTVRIIFVARGERIKATILGFFEVLIWVVAISQIILHLDNWLCYIAYAGGFATGNCIGMMIEEKLALGYCVVRIITMKDEKSIKTRLAAENFGVTIIDAEGTNGKVKMVLTVIKRRDLKKAMHIIDTSSHNAFVTIEDSRHASEGIFPRANKRFDPLARLLKSA